MIIYLLQIVGKWISLFVVSIISLFHLNTGLMEETYQVGNDNNDKNVSVIDQIIPHGIETSYRGNMPSNITKVTIFGQDGVEFTNENGEIQTIRPMITEVVETGTGAYGELTGVSTGYGPDCKTCSGKGTVACKTPNGKWYNLIDDGIYYEDMEFGKVRILSAAKEKFPCGTVMRVDNGVMEPFLGIVLDTGSAMINAWKDSKVHIDIAFETEKDEMVHRATNMKGTVQYSVQRWGW